MRCSATTGHSKKGIRFENPTTSDNNAFSYTPRDQRSLPVTLGAKRFIALVHRYISDKYSERALAYLRYYI
jgi:hypothetical protein